MKKTMVKFSPETEEVMGGTISCVTEIDIPATDKTNGIEFEISVFQCECGCPECISVVQTTINREDPEETSTQQVTISPEDFQHFMSALKKCYEKIISKKN
jgi:hypothetical protein